MTTLDAKLSITPSKSHNFLVSLLIMASLCLFTGFYFLWETRDGSYIPIAIGIVIFLVAVIGWFFSQKSVDLDGSSPTEITGNNGLQIKTDSRTLAMPESAKNLEKLISSFNHLRPVPEADGLVDSKGLPIPESKKAANDIINAINHENFKNISLLSGGIAPEEGSMIMPIQKNDILIPDTIPQLNFPEENA